LRRKPADLLLLEIVPEGKCAAAGAGKPASVLSVFLFPQHGGYLLCVVLLMRAFRTAGVRRFFQLK
jgi:hypothetical protein